MIPISLKLSGFLSYRDPVELDFTTFDLACIAGPNGAGKSSLLDAITWALFGQARKRDESMINTRSDAAEVTFSFAYEGNTYRVQRSNPRGKSSLVEFHILTPDGDWKPLTERTLRETDARIQETLRMDYETFVNASFFLQGKADQFTQQRSGDRKRILSSILGLEIWETYRQQAAKRRREVEADIDNLDGRLQEIQVELDEEGTRKAHLEELERELERLSAARSAQEANLENIRKITATLVEQGKLVGALARGLDAATQALAELEGRLEAREAERAGHALTLSHAGEIEAAYQAWQEARDELSRWEEIAARFREHERARAEPLTEIETARARLETELQGLQSQQETLQGELAQVPGVENQLHTARAALQEAQDLLDRRAGLDQDLQAARDRQAEARAENPRLREAMNQLKERIDRLEGAAGAVCPLCGQPLSPAERQSLIEELSAQGAEMGDRFRANKVLLEETDQAVRALEGEIAALSKAEDDRRAHARTVDQLTARLEIIRKQEADWQQQAAPRLEEIRLSLEAEKFAPQARARLAAVDAELKATGYDAAAHDAVRRDELAGRAAEADRHALESARAALGPLEREIADLKVQIQAQRADLSRQEKEHDEAAAALAAAEAQAPDLAEAEAELYRLQEDENRLRLEVGAAQQKVQVLDDLKTRRQSLAAEREELAQRIGEYRQLERAFGRDGVPALLIEQALPEIESRANDILERLSGGMMSVRFVTQAAYKDRRRSDLRETLDIQISDEAGVRDYEMFSGGEAFRVNFAIRLALSEVLAMRAGARLQTLVIDEGFGSQDAIGRQRLIEAINMVRQDFAKILVITHIDELKDAFPTRIEVEKTTRGSAVQVI